MNMHISTLVPRSVEYTCYLPGLYSYTPICIFNIYPKPLSLHIGNLSLRTLFLIQ